MNSGFFYLGEFSFTAKELDEETNLYYMSARYFSPKTGVWISADPAGGELINPNRRGFKLTESTHWYSYVDNNPVNYNDPTGLLSNDPQPIVPPGQDITGTGPSEDTSNYIQSVDVETAAPADTTTKKSPIVDIGLSLRLSQIIGGEVGAGIVINPNNLWDSGIKLKGGVGIGWEVNVDTPLDPVVSKTIEMVTGMSNFQRNPPTSTKDIEGGGLEIKASTGLGLSFDLQNKSVNGIETFSIGGGFYASGTTVITVGEVGEAVTNFVLSPLILVGIMNPINLDGQ